MRNLNFILVYFKVLNTFNTTPTVNIKYRLSLVPSVSFLFCIKAKSKCKIYTRYFSFMYDCGKVRCRNLFFLSCEFSTKFPYKSLRPPLFKSSFSVFFLVALKCGDGYYILFNIFGITP